MASKETHPTINPSDFGGFGRDLQNKDARGGLQGRQFDAFCAPQPLENTIIIGVCGIVDRWNGANPSGDGWFYSDFFLMHHLLKDAPLSEQLWLAPEAPNDLVGKWGEYIHGDPAFGQRRVVLDQELLSEVQDIEVVECLPGYRSALRDRFLRRLKDACNATRRSNTNILVLLFCHGQKSHSAEFMLGDHEFELGGLPDSKGNWNEIIVTKTRLKEVIGDHPGVSLFTTSCYGGAWAKAPHLNLTTMASVPEDVMSDSWDRSASIPKRFCGGRYVTAMTEALIKMRFRAEDIHGDQFDEVLNSQDGETYASLLKTVRMKMEAVSSVVAHHITWSSRDDEWAKEWHIRTGIPLVHFQQQWRSLRAGPPASGYSDASRTASVKLSPLGPVLTAEQLRPQLALSARKYLNSYPGRDSQASNNWLHSTIEGFFEGQDEKKMSVSLDALHEKIQKRLSIMTLATSIKEALGLKDALDCEQTDAFNEPRELFRFLPLIQEHHFFPVDLFTKGEVYLSVIMAKAGWTEEKAAEELKRVRGSLGQLYDDQEQAKGLGLDRIEQAETLLNETIRGRKMTLRKRPYTPESSLPGSPPRSPRSPSPIKCQRTSIHEAFPEWTGGKET